MRFDSRPRPPQTGSTLEVRKKVAKEATIIKNTDVWHKEIRDLSSFLGGLSSKEYALEVVENPEELNEFALELAKLDDVLRDIEEYFASQESTEKKEIERQRFDLLLSGLLTLLERLYNSCKKEKKLERLVGWLKSSIADVEDLALRL